MNPAKFTLITTLLWSTYHTSAQGQHGSTTDTTVHYNSESHLTNIRQLTFGGDYAEAYFSFDGRRVSFQATDPKKGVACDQIFFGEPDHFDPKMISTGKGRTTCSYFLPGDSLVLYASTHEGDTACPPKPAPRADKKYVWALYEDFDIYVTGLDGRIRKKLTDSPGYDAEATVSPRGDKIVFTSVRSGDIELYVMNIDGTGLVQVTRELGYDGGAFFSPDGTHLVFRASRPKTPEEITAYKGLLAEGLVTPTNMEIFTCKVDGSDLKQVTHLGGANWAPYFTPDGKKIIFSSNHQTKGYKFNLWMIGTDGSGLEQISFDHVFDAFPVFSPDGKRLIFSSNRNNNGTRDTNLFIADWKE